VLHRREALDVVDLEIQREGHQPPDPRDPQEPLHGGIVEQIPLDRLLQLFDLGAEQCHLGRVHPRLELVERWQLGHVGDVELLEHRLQRERAPDVPLHQLQPCAQHVARPPHRVGDHVGVRDEIHPQQLGKGVGIDGIGLHFGVRDRLQQLRVGQLQVHTGRRQQIP